MLSKLTVHEIPVETHPIQIPGAELKNTSYSKQMKSPESCVRLKKF